MLKQGIMQVTLMAFLLGMVFMPATGFSVTFTVNSTVDAVDASPGDGACATAGGVCTLRAAIQEANALAGDDIITLPTGTYTLSIAGANEEAAATGDLDITSNITINGAGASSTIIDGGAIDRVFQIPSVFTVSISGVKIQNGNPPSSVGGGIWNDGALTVTNSSIVNNTALQGGGIFSSFGTTLVLTNVTVSGNNASGSYGGGVFKGNDAVVTITDSVISSNTATNNGGGIYSLSGGSMTIDNSAVSGNSAQIGGGIFNEGALIVTDSVISANTAAPSSAGGIWNNGSVTLTNVTVSGNSTAEMGGGIVSLVTGTLTNVTVTGNTANSDNAGFEPGGGIAVLAGTVNVKNSIIAGNAVGTGSTSPDCSGTLTSQNNNLIQNTAGCTLSGGTGDITGQNPLLDTLANNGGPTQTHALLSGSPAIDAGTNTGCPATDQRGISRPQDGNNDSVAVCDMGAYELQLIPDITVTDSVAPTGDLQIPFGSITQGTTSDQTVTVTNNGAGNLIIGAVASTNSLAAPFSITANTCSGQTVAPAATCGITVRFAPTATGAFNDSFDIPSNDPDENPVTVSVSGTGTAAPVPDIAVTDSVSPDNDLTVSFGNVTQGVTSAAQTVTIANTGTAALNVSNIQITGADAAQFSLNLNGGTSPCGSASPTITAGSNCTVTVTFSPQTTGEKSATLAITSNDPDEGTVNVALSGTGLSSVTNNAPAAPTLVFPANGQTGLSATVTFRWKKTTDPDGDTVAYKLLYCTDQSFAGCSPVDVAYAAGSRGKGQGSGAISAISYAGFEWMGLALLALLFGGAIIGRRKIALLMVSLMIAGGVLISCGGGGGGGGVPADEMSYTVSGLNSGATYYWKVVAHDGNGGTAESEVWSFTTQ